MKKFFRGTLSVLLAVLLCTAMLVPATAAEGDEMRSAKKIISVVYDDSGSMLGDHWVYTNYAMQALIAQLNEQDQLFITYMTDSSNAIEIDLSNIENAVSDVRAHSDSGGTPFDAVTTAKSKLESINESDLSAQFWLFVLTDGSMSGIPSGSIQTELDGFKGQKMSNGSSLNVVYFSMGAGTVVTEDKPNGLHTFNATTPESVSVEMSKISNLISGRITADNVTQVDDHTISFSSTLPLYSISVLSQQSTAKVQEAKTKEQTLDINRNISLSATDPYQSTPTALYGNAAVIVKKGQNTSSDIIPADTYTITFTEPVNVKDLVVQYEPAIAMKMTVYKQGVEITDLSKLIIDDEITVELIPVVPGTNDKIEDSALPKGITWSIEYLIDGKSVASTQGTKLTGIKVNKGTNTRRGTMQIPGFAPLIFEADFFVEEIILNLGIDVDQPDPLSYNRKNVHKGSKEGGSVSFTLTNDGQPLSKEDLEKFGIDLQISSIECDNSKVTGFLNRFGKSKYECELELNDDGSYSLVPKASLPFTAFLKMAGVYTVTVTSNKDEALTATGTFTVVPSPTDWIDLLWLLIVLAVLLYLTYIIFIKYKFKGQVIVSETYKLMSDGKGSEVPSAAQSKRLSPLSGGLLLPKRACEIKFRGLTLRAGPGGEIVVTGKSIARSVTNYGASASNPTNSLKSIVSSMRSTVKKSKDGKKQERVAVDQSLSSKRKLYLRSTETDRNIWTIHLK